MLRTRHISIYRYYPLGMDFLYQFNLRLHHFSQFLFNIKQNEFQNFQMLAGMWFVGDVVIHVGTYGSKAVEGWSVLQRRSCIAIWGRHASVILVTRMQPVLSANLVENNGNTPSGLESTWIYGVQILYWCPEQDYSISIAKSREILQSWNKPSIWDFVAIFQITSGPLFTKR